jgi:hypothetical protein
VGYVVDWLRCARRNGLSVSYVGGWNEHYLGTGDRQAWFVNLRTALDAARFTRTVSSRPARLRRWPNGPGGCDILRCSSRRPWPTTWSPIRPPAGWSAFRGYELRVRGNGAWQVVTNGPAAVTLASGSLGYYATRYPGFTIRPQ